MTPSWFSLLFSIASQHRKFVEHSRFALTILDGNCTMEHRNMVSEDVVYLRKLLSFLFLCFLPLFHLPSSHPVALFPSFPFSSFPPSLPLSLPAILYAVVAILCVAVVWGVGKVVWWYMKDRGFLHYLHLTRVDRVTARVTAPPHHMHLYQDTPLIRTHHKSGHHTN